MVITGPNGHQASAGVIIESRRPASLGFYLLSTVRVDFPISATSMGGNVTGPVSGTIFWFDAAWATGAAGTGGPASALLLIKLDDDPIQPVSNECLNIVISAAGAISLTVPTTILVPFNETDPPVAGRPLSFAPLVPSVEPCYAVDLDGQPRRFMEGSLARGKGAQSGSTGWGVLIDANDKTGEMFAVGMNDAMTTLTPQLP